jgi:serine/threonine protein kinase
LIPFIAILHLETEKKVHRDISYTNILLRERDDSVAGKAARENVMDKLGLSEIEKLRTRLNCREGLLIDFDYAAVLVEESNASEEKKSEVGDLKPGSGSRTVSNSKSCPSVTGLNILQGTPPFIAIELLLFGVPHRVAHDLESLFYVLVFICSHLGGPHNTIGNPPLYGGVTGCDHPSAIKQWLCSTNLVILGKMKFGDMVGFFEDAVLPFISPYFLPLKHHLCSLWNTILPQRSKKPSIGKDSVHSHVTCYDIIGVLKTILLDKSLIDQAEQAATTLGKRSLPGELDIVSNGWYAIRPSKKILMRNPKISPSTAPRQSKLMSKGKKKS